MPFYPTVVSFATEGTGYQNCLVDLVSSCRKFNIPRSVDTIPNCGSWEVNCSQKPSYLLRKLDELRRPILWVDADGEFMAEPHLFDGLDCDVAVHRNPVGQILSGTVYLNDTTPARRLVEAWSALCGEDPRTWDQKHLEAALDRLKGLRVFYLPREYCAVFDHYKVENPVILHKQASRTLKRKVRLKAAAK